MKKWWSNYCKYVSSYLRKLRYIFLITLIDNCLFSPHVKQIAIYCAEMAPNGALNGQRVVVFHRLSANAVHISNSFLMHKCLCKIMNTLPSDIFKVSVISRNFNLRSAQTILWTFLCFLEQLPNLADQCVQHHRFLYGRI